MKSCQACDKAFTPKVKYQVYCSDQCREVATKQKIAERYAMLRRKRLMEKKRFCRSCGTPLSAYNDDQICQACVVDPKEVNRILKQIKGIANGKESLDDETN